jgi:CheY-like chemotaxis protein
MPTAPTITILYVEDDALIREVVAIALEDAGFEVIAAPDATSAFAALRIRNEHPVGAVVTDINLGAGPDGWEVARRARQRDGGIPVVYMTGASGNEWQSKGLPGSAIIAKRVGSRSPKPAHKLPTGLLSCFTLVSTTYLALSSFARISTS